MTDEGGSRLERGPRSQSPQPPSNLQAAIAAIQAGQLSLNQV